MWHKIENFIDGAGPCPGSEFNDNCWATAVDDRDTIFDRVVVGRWSLSWSPLTVFALGCVLQW